MKIQNTNAHQNVGIVEHEIEVYNKHSFLDYLKSTYKEAKKRDGYEDEAETVKFPTRILANELDIDYEVFRKILNQEKPTKKRDCIIVICFLLHFNRDEVDEALKRYNYMSLLDDYNPRDDKIIELLQKQIQKNVSISCTELDNHLIQEGFQGLDIHNRRGKRKKAEKELTRMDIYEIRTIKVRTPIDTYYYVDKYDSLCNTYSAYRCTGDMYIVEKETGKRFILTFSSDGTILSQDYDSGERAQVHISNANALVEGNQAVYRLIDDSRRPKWKP